MTDQQQTLTPSERAEALDILTRSSIDLRSTVSRLTPAQWRHQPSAAAWAPADVVDHLAKSENAIYQLVATVLLHQPPVAAGRRTTLKDMAVVMAAHNRQVKHQSLELVRPVRTWTTAAGLLEEFETRRARTVAFLRGSQDDLRGRLADHPVLGMIDAFQWLLFAGAHTERHHDQIREIISDKGFPR